MDKPVFKNNIGEIINDEQFWVMDGRANYSIDDAQCLVTCGTFKEAKGAIHDYGNDSCIVKVVISNGEYTFELVYSLFWEDEVNHA